MTFFPFSIFDTYLIDWNFDFIPFRIRLSGIATHFVQSHKIEDLVKSLSLLNAYTMNDIVSLINEFSGKYAFLQRFYKHYNVISFFQVVVSQICFQIH